MLSFTTFPKLLLGQACCYPRLAIFRSTATSALHSKQPETEQNGRILTFADIEENVKKEFISSLNSHSVRLASLPKLGSIINGFRSGELTVFSGPTGAGKTTVLSQISLDYCMQGIKTLWGSFEIKNARLGQIMLQQLSRASTSQERFEEQFSRASLRIKQLPMYFLDFFGSTDLSMVVQAMYQAVRENGVQHIILDNLQFMLSDQHSFRFDKFELADRTVSTLRNFCNTLNAHVTIVIHPRKEDEGAALGLSSISGTAKATQEADNVIIIQKLYSGTFIDVKKNRFEGTLGRVKVRYNRDCKMVSALL